MQKLCETSPSRPFGPITPDRCSAQQVIERYKDRSASHRPAVTPVDKFDAKGFWGYRQRPPPSALPFDFGRKIGDTPEETPISAAKSAMVRGWFGDRTTTEARVRGRGFVVVQKEDNRNRPTSPTGKLSDGDSFEPGAAGFGRERVPALSPRGHVPALGHGLEEFVRALGARFLEGEVFHPCLA